MSAWLVAVAASEFGCVSSVPVEPYVLARAAYESAHEAEAVRYAPGPWYNAEQNYREGQKAYRDRRYNDAEAFFEQARIDAEQAEVESRIARRSSGDLP